MTFTQCGSGSDVTISGYFVEMLYPDYKRDQLATLQNFPKHIASVPYLDLETNINFTCYTGLFESTITDEMLLPHFRHIVCKDV